MKPVIALIGRPNVGKSTLFNALTRSRDALVVDIPGMTRDRKYGEGFFQEQAFIVIDTGGLSGDESGVDLHMAEQSEMAILEADAVFFVVDAKTGITPHDEKIAQKLRSLEKTIYVVANKVDGSDPDIVCADFYQFGLGEPHPVTATHRRGIQTLLELSLGALESQEDEIEKEDGGVKVALIGRPNVGKSTLTNRLLGEERVIVYDMPGTTRDSISIPMERRGQKYTIIDTAGVRRKGKVKETVEKFSVVKTLKSIEEADVTMILIDAQEGITEQDLHVIGFALDAGRAMVLAVNKWDGLEQDYKEHLKSELKRRLPFIIDYVDIHFISALHGTAVGDLYASIDDAYESATKPLSTSFLTKVLESAVQEHQPPLVHGRRIKLRYAHLGGHRPPTVIIHGKQVDRLPNSYTRFLMGYFRQACELVGTPVKIIMKADENPYEGRYNKLTPRQAHAKDKRKSRTPKKK